MDTSGGCSSSNTKTAPQPVRAHLRTPVHTLSNADVKLEQSRFTYEHFHAPFNQNNRFMAAITNTDKLFLRDYQRAPLFKAVGQPPPSQYDEDSYPGSPEYAELYSPPDSPERPQSAPMSPRPKLAPGQYPPGLELLPADNGWTCMTATNGSPVFSIQAKVDADLIEGSALGMPDSPVVDDWRKVKVQTYAVPPSRHGFGATGTRPFHQDYRHYKYMGFAGKGAKTSWAHNPKLAAKHTCPGTCDPDASIPRSTRRTTDFRRNRSDTRQPVARMDEAHMCTVDIHSRKALAPESELEEEAVPKSAQYIRVATYTHPKPWDKEGDDYSEVITPSHGDVVPFHQRYRHYKYHGFAGQGATSSWARNPKMAVLYD